jgi:hypothetical protein
MAATIIVALALIKHVFVISIFHNNYTEWAAVKEH